MLWVYFTLVLVCLAPVPGGVFISVPMLDTFIYCLSKWYSYISLLNPFVREIINFCRIFDKFSIDELLIWRLGLKFVNVLSCDIWYAVKTQVSFYFWSKYSISNAHISYKGSSFSLNIYNARFDICCI